MTGVVQSVAGVVQAPDDIRVLVVHRRPRDARAIGDALASSLPPRIDVDCVSALPDAARALAEAWFDVVMLDLDAPEAGGIEGLARLVELAPEAAVVALSDRDDHDLAVRALAAGAQDCLLAAAITPRERESVRRSVVLAHTHNLVEQVSRRLASIVDDCAEAIVGVDRGGTITSWNAAAERLYGYNAQTAIGRPIAMLSCSDTQQLEIEDLLATAAGGERVVDFETTRLRGDGRVIDVSLTASPIVVSGGRVVGTVTHARDVSDRKRAERARERTRAELLEQRELLASVFENAPIGLAIVSPEGRFERVNHALCAITGYSEDEMLALSYHQLTHPEDLGSAGDGGWAQTVEHPVLRAEQRYLHRDGHVVWINLSVTAMYDKDGALLRFVSQCEDISAHKEAEQERRRYHAELERLAMHDSLTGLPNHRLFHQRLEEEVANSVRHGRPLSLALIDVDRFKSVNDRHGHLVGDRTLEEVARRLGAVARQGEVLARVGGEEFAWILPSPTYVVRCSPPSVRATRSAPSHCARSAGSRSRSGSPSSTPRSIARASTSRRTRRSTKPSARDATAPSRTPARRRGRAPPRVRAPCSSLSWTMAASSKIAILLERMAQGVAIHNRENPTHNTWGIGMANFDIERLGLEDGEEILPGIVLQADGGGTGQFRILCDGDHGQEAEEAEEEVLDAVADQEVVEVAPGPAESIPEPLRPRSERSRRGSGRRRNARPSRDDGAQPRDRRARDSESRARSQDGALDRVEFRRAPGSEVALHRGAERRVSAVELGERCRGRDARAVRSGDRSSLLDGADQRFPPFGVAADRA